MGKKEKSRSLHFATILYPESCNQDFRKLISEWHVCAWLSPLHDPDPEDGNLKPHYHLLFSFDSLKSREQALILINELGGVGCMMVNSRIGYARYLMHLDNPEKQQFSEDVVPESWGWISYDTLIEVEKDISEVLGEIMDFCDVTDITSYYLLSSYCRKYNKRWFKVVTQHATVFLTAYLKSRKYTVEKQIGDSEIGDVLEVLKEKVEGN